MDRIYWQEYIFCHSFLIFYFSWICFFLNRKRIQEGFTLAYNEGGVVNLVKEFMMKDDDDVDNNDDADNGGVGSTFPCLVQYIIFPSNVVIRNHQNNNLNNNNGQDDNR